MSSRYHQPHAEALYVPLWQHKALLRTGWARAQQYQLPPRGRVWTSPQPGWGCGEELEKEGGCVDLKIVPVSFLLLSFTVRKRARGLPAPVHTMPYIMGGTRALLRAGNRQGRDIYAALPKPMSSSRVPGPWKQPPGWGKRLAWLAGATQPQPRAREEVRESGVQPEGEGWPPDTGCWQKAGRSC